VTIRCGYTARRTAQYGNWLSQWRGDLPATTRVEGQTPTLLGDYVTARLEDRGQQGGECPNFGHRTVGSESPPPKITGGDQRVHVSPTKPNTQSAGNTRPQKMTAGRWVLKPCTHGCSAVESPSCNFTRRTAAVGGHSQLAISLCSVSMRVGLPRRWRRGCRVPVCGGQTWVTRVPMSWPFTSLVSRYLWDPKRTNAIGSRRLALSRVTIPRRQD
jgi:hypothetical protein